MKKRSYKPIHEALENVYMHLVNNFPNDKKIFDIFVEKFLHTSKDTYEATRYILKCGLDFSLHANLLTRFMMEILFNLIFMKQDRLNRAKWFGKVSFKDLLKARNQFETRWNDNSLGAKSLIDSYNQVLRSYILDYEMTQMEISTPESQIKKWPIPDRMLKNEKWWEGKSLKDKEFLYFLLECFYGEASELMHCRSSALVFAVGKRYLEVDNDTKEGILTNPYMENATFFLCILTEIANIYNFPIESMLTNAWMEIYGFRNDIIELIKKRYSQYIDWNKAKLWSEE